jgi:hypothetical protein
MYGHGPGNQDQTVIEYDDEHETGRRDWSVILIASRRESELVTSDLPGGGDEQQSRQP